MSHTRSILPPVSYHKISMYYYQNVEETYCTQYNLFHLLCICSLCVHIWLLLVYVIYVWPGNGYQSSIIFTLKAFNVMNPNISYTLFFLQEHHWTISSCDAFLSLWTFLAAIQSRKYSWGTQRIWVKIILGGLSYISSGPDQDKK